MRIALFCLFALSLAGCAGSPRFVTKNANDGIVSIPDASNHWPYHYHDKAIEMIKQHVGPDFEILKEEEVITGQQVINDQNVDTESRPTIVPWMQQQTQRVQHTETTRDLTEWRIHYRKRNGPTVNASPTTSVNLASGTSPMTLPPIVTPGEAAPQPSALR